MGLFLQGGNRADYYIAKDFVMNKTPKHIRTLTNYTKHCLKKTVNFWKCWRAKFDVSVNKCTEVSGCVDSAVIVNKFADHFASSYCCNSTGRADSLREEYLRLRDGYSGNPYLMTIYLTRRLSVESSLT